MEYWIDDLAVDGGLVVSGGGCGLGDQGLVGAVGLICGVWRCVCEMSGEGLSELVCV